MKRLLLTLWIALVLPHSPLRAEETVTVFAAASLSGVLEETAQDFDGDVTFSYGGSGSIARQVAAGAPADVVILANQIWMDWLATQGIVAAQTSTDVAGNTLVLIAPAGATQPKTAPDIVAILDQNRLAVGHREAVPAGVYARQWMTHIGMWDYLSERLAETDNVRAALTLVARKETPLGVVYASDAMAEPLVRIVFEIHRDTHDPITYPAAGLTPQGAAFVAYLGSDAAQAIFVKRGFTNGVSLGE